MTIPKRRCQILKTKLFPNPMSPSSIFACNRIQAAPYLLRLSRRVNVRKARWRIVEILISLTSQAKKEPAYSLFTLASPQASWKGEWIGSRFLGWFIFPCGLGLKIYYLCASYLFARLRLGRIFFKLFGKRAHTSTISCISFCTSVFCKKNWAVV